MDNLKNKISLITGGNSGIGYATAKEMKTQGATVIITGRRAAAIEKAAKELDVTAIVADQGNISAIEDLARQVKEQFGRIDILFINAGIIGMSTIEEATETLFDEVMAVNFKGAYFTLSKFIPLLKDGASVVFLSSNTASSNNIASSIYSSGKAALNSVMRIAGLCEHSFQLPQRPRFTRSLRWLRSPLWRSTPAYHPLSTTYSLLRANSVRIPEGKLQAVQADVSSCSYPSYSAAISTSIRCAF